MGIEFLLDQTFEVLKLLDGCAGKVTRAGVDQAEGAQATAAGVEKRKAGVETNAWSTDDQRIVCKALVRQCVLHDQWRTIGDRVGAERDLARSLFCIQAHRGFEPLPVFVHERHQSDGNLGDFRSQTRDAVEPFFGLGIENG